MLRSKSFAQQVFLQIPPGDDAAVLNNGTVLSNDGLTEGTHFRMAWEKSCQSLLGVGLGRALGWKLMGSSLSDLAAMGDVVDRWAVLYAGVPGATKTKFMMDFLSGVTDYAKRFRCTIAGGDTVKAKQVTFVATVGGVRKGRMVTRTGARPGDQICVAGTIGDAGIGLNVLDQKVSLPRSDARFFAKRFFEHEPRFIDGAVIAKTKGVTSLIDVSDSLQETIEIVSARRGANVDVGAIPVSSAYKRHFPVDARLLRGGEDYALLFTASKGAVTALKRTAPVRVIGEISSNKECRYWLNGRAVRTKSYFTQF